jgi:hypothetical protein
VEKTEGWVKDRKKEVDGEKEYELGEREKEGWGEVVLRLVEVVVSMRWWGYGWRW